MVESETSHSEEGRALFTKSKQFLLEQGAFSYNEGEEGGFIGRSIVNPDGKVTTLRTRRTAFVPEPAFAELASDELYLVIIDDDGNEKDSKWFSLNKEGQLADLRAQHPRGIKRLFQKDSPPPTIQEVSDIIGKVNF